MRSLPSLGNRRRADVSFLTPFFSFTESSTRTDGFSTPSDPFLTPRSAFSLTLEPSPAERPYTNCPYLFSRLSLTSAVVSHHGHSFLSYRWKCFDKHPGVGGCCGEICVDRGRGCSNLIK